MSGGAPWFPISENSVEDGQDRSGDCDKGAFFCACSHRDRRAACDKGAAWKNILMMGSLPPVVVPCAPRHEMLLCRQGIHQIQREIPVRASPFRDDADGIVQRDLNEAEKVEAEQRLWPMVRQSVGQISALCLASGERAAVHIEVTRYRRRGGMEIGGAIRRLRHALRKLSTRLC
jgi:hypothetical protein